MPRTIPQRELRNDNAKVIQAVLAGESFVITRHGEPVAELRPIRRGRRTFVPKEDFVKNVLSGPPIDYKQFREDMDRFVDPWVEL